MFATTRKTFLLAVALLLGATSVSAETLVTEQSTVRFVSVKNDAVAEVHSFSGLSGGIDTAGHVSIVIPLATVETLVPIRNERMQALLFETVTFPSALLEADIDRSLIDALASGDFTEMPLQLRVTLHGVSQSLQTIVGVARLGDELHVVTISPVIIDAGAFELGAGVERLREIASLKSISSAVPVTARLVFTR